MHTIYARFQHSGNGILQICFLSSYFRRTAIEIDDREKAGTYAYMSPEVVSEKAYGRSMDWWSMGVTLFKLMIGRVPFRSNDEKELQVPL